MAAVQPPQANHHTGGAFHWQVPRPIPHPQDHYAQHNYVPPAAADDRFEGLLGDIPQPVGGVHVVGPGRPQDLHHADLAYQGILDYHPLPLRDPPAYVFPDEVVAQRIPAQGQPNSPENLEHGHAFQHIPLFLAQAAFPDPFAHRIPAPGQPAAENLRRLAIRYLHQPDSQVDLVSMEAGAAGLCKVVIVLELADVF